MNDGSGEALLFGCVQCKRTMAYGAPADCCFHPAALEDGSTMRGSEEVEYQYFPCCRGGAHAPGCRTGAHRLLIDVEQVMPRLRRLPAEEWNAWRSRYGAAVLDLDGLQALEKKERDLPGRMLFDARLKVWVSNLNLVGADLSRGDFGSSHLAECSLAGSRLQAVSFGSASLSRVDLSGVTGENVDFSNARLWNCSFSGAHLPQADFSRAHAHHDPMDEETLDVGFESADLSSAKFNEAMLSGISFRRARLSDADFSLAQMSDVHMEQAVLDRATLSGVPLTAANFEGASLRQAKLNGCQLMRANLRNADLAGADLSDTNLAYADLSGADLTGANLAGANLLEANFSRAKLVDCRVYGVCAWSLNLDDAFQQDMVISKPGQPLLTVDDIEVAQFIHVMLNNARIRSVIDNITSMGVLILGRLGDKTRKKVLDGLRDELQKFDLLPMMFDFDRPANKDYTETVQTLASLCMFVVADITNPKSTPLELEALAKQFKIPYLPIIDKSVDEYAFSMLQDLQKSFPWVLPVLRYNGPDALFQDGVIEEMLVNRAKRKRDQLRAMKNVEMTTIDVDLDWVRPQGRPDER